MEFQIQLSGLPQVQANLAALRARLQNLSPALKRIGVMELASAQGRIETGGDGSWAPTVENSMGSPLNRTGGLLRSLTVGGSGNLFQDIDNGVRVGTNMQVGSYNLGQLLQGGTGIYGPSGRKIEPTGKALAFTLNGHKVFAKSVSGAPKRKFLFISDTDAQRAVGIMKTYITSGAE